MSKINKPKTSNVIYLIVAIVVLGLIGFSVSKIQELDSKIKIQHIEIEDKSKSVDNLTEKLKKVNSELDKTKNSDEESKKRIEQLEKEKQELQKKVQAKREEKERLARASELSKQASAKSVPAPKPAQQPARATSAPVSNLTHSKQEMMAMAGIPQSDWQYVDSIISRESGWRHTVWNAEGSGAYGLCQSLPAVKMASAGADYMTNPVTQLKWCHGYAMSRYKGWYQAYTFWNANRWW